VYCIVLHHKGYAQAARCLQSLRKIQRSGLRTVLVDNGSTDGSLEQLRLEFPEVSYLLLGQNQGFSKGNNRGIVLAMESGADYVWLLNDDTEVTPDSLNGLLVETEQADVGAAASILLNPDGSIQTWGGGRVSFWTGLPYEFLSPAKTGALQHLKGASLLLKVKALREVGCLWEELFLYWEDTDLSFRLRQCGWEIRAAEKSEVLHLGGGTIQFRSVGWDYHFTYSATRFFQRHAPFPAWPIAVSGLGRVLNRCREGLWPNAGAALKGMSLGIWRGLTTNRPSSGNV
jgi:GT2 family glycosyltransferase